MNEFTPVLKNKKFLLLWLSQVLSQITINMLNFLLLIRLYEKTNSTIATSFLWVAYALPAVLVGPFAAVGVDMMDRRKILTFANIAQAVTIFLYAFLQRNSLFILYGVILIYSLFNQFYVPAEQASLPAILKKEYLARANALFFLTLNAAVIFGFGVAGFSLELIGFENSLYLCSILLVIAFISTFFLPKMLPKLTGVGRLESGFEIFFRRIYEGYQFIKGNKPVLNVFVMFLGLQVALATLVVNFPVIGTDIMGISPRLTGPFVAIPGGIGAFIGSILVTKLLGRGWRKIHIVERAVMLLVIVIFVFILIVPEITYYPIRLIVGMIGVAVAGGCFVGLAVPAQTFLQEQTPGGLQGRVFGNFWFLATVLTIFPVIGSGTIAEIFGIRVLMAVVFGGSLFVLIMIKKAIKTGEYPIGAKTYDK